MRNVIMFVCALAIAAAAAGAQAVKSPQKPGKWQITMEMEMPGMPMKMPPVTSEVCLTEADLEDPQKAVPKDAKSDCKISDYKVVGNTVTWAMVCPSQKMKGTGEATYTGDTYTATMKMEMGEQKMSMKHSGKWLGTCSK